MAYEILPTFNQSQEIINVLKEIRGNTGSGKVYGIYWNRTTGDVTRVADSVGLSYTKEVDGDTTTVVSDFDDKYPFAGMRRCNYDMNAEKVLRYFGHGNFTDTPPQGVEVMVELPKFYYQTQSVSNGVIWLVSEYKREGFSVHPAFVRDGVEKDKIYISAYEGAVYDTSTTTYIDGDNVIGTLANGLLRSVGGQQPSSNHDITEFRTMATQNGGTQYDALSHWALAYLQIIEYGTLNLQTVFDGVVDYDMDTGNHAQNTGHTSVLGNQSGEVDVPAENGATGSTSQKVFSYRGVENVYGNIWKFIDGINLSPSGDLGGVYIADHDFASDTFVAPYKRVGAYPADTGNGYMDDVMINELIDYGFVPSSTQGSSSTDFADFIYKSTSSNCVARVGGSWYNGGRDGTFHLLLNISSAYSYRYIGARLLKF